jgi:DNA (cytosine-5)-methyltransferase 1
VDREDRHTLIARAFGGNNTSGPIEVATALNACASASGRMDFETETFVAHCLKAEGADASEDGTGRGVPLVAFDTTQITSQTNRCNPQPGDPCHSLATGAHAPAIACNLRGREGGSQPETSDVASMRAASGGSSRSDVAQTLTAEQHRSGGAMAGNSAGVVNLVFPPAGGVRRLTPRECERLQGFPDDYTLIPYRGKFAADGPRYKALGNSMAINVMSWVGERIRLVNGLLRGADNGEVPPASEAMRRAPGARAK